MQDFRQLIVWKRAHVFAINVRQACRGFPRTGYSDLKSQLSRAAESIASNIVEGCGAATRKEFARFLDISIKSTSEVDYQLELARDYRVLSYHDWKALASEAVQIRKMLFALRRAVLAADQAAQSTEPARREPPDPETKPPKPGVPRD
jgi:four helix bundle protein